MLHASMFQVSQAEGTESVWHVDFSEGGFGERGEINFGLYLNANLPKLQFANQFAN